MLNNNTVRDNVDSQVSQSTNQSINHNVLPVDCCHSVWSHPLPRMSYAWMSLWKSLELIRRRPASAHATLAGCTCVRSRGLDTGTDQKWRHIPSHVIHRCRSRMAHSRRRWRPTCCNNQPVYTVITIVTGSRSSENTTHYSIIIGEGVLLTARQHSARSTYQERGPKLEICIEGRFPIFTIVCVVCTFHEASEPDSTQTSS